MNNYIRLAAAALCLGIVALLAATSSAQNKGAKLQAISQQLNLTPQQKAKILPILADEGPKVEAIKNNYARPFGSLTQMGTIRLGKRNANKRRSVFISPMVLRNAP